MATSHFILGGARSGKSRFALATLADRGRVAFVASAQAGDRDMAERIARHRAERPRPRLNIEEPFALAPRLTSLAALVGRSLFDLTVVSNEVGEGVVPETADGMRLRDLLGSVNQRLAAVCDRVTLMVAGLPLTIKTPGRGHDVTPQTA